MENKEFKEKGVITVAQKDAIVARAIANAKAQMLAKAKAAAQKDKDTAAASIGQPTAPQAAPISTA